MKPLTDLSRCDHMGVCMLHQACTSHAACQQAFQARTPADLTPTSVQGMFTLCEATLVGLAFVAGMFAGGWVTTVYSAELRQLFWAALHVFS